MRALALSACLALCFAGATLAATPQAAVIPDRFHGEWNSELDRCGDRESGANLIIDATSITYFEAGDDVLAVQPAELDGINILVDHEDYDGIERLSRTLILSDDQQKLSFAHGDGPESVVLRCP